MKPSHWFLCSESLQLNRARCSNVRSPGSRRDEALTLIKHAYICCFAVQPPFYAETIGHHRQSYEARAILCSEALNLMELAVHKSHDLTIPVVQMLGPPCSSRDEALTLTGSSMARTRGFLNESMASGNRSPGMLASLVDGEDDEILALAVSSSMSKTRVELLNESACCGNRSPGTLTSPVTVRMMGYLRGKEHSIVRTCKF